MVISDKHRYLFIEVPHTGSTAISNELIENYEGRKILHKHANYHEFLDIASPKEKEYFVFAGVRNPLDEAASLYQKFLTNHKENYTDPNKRRENGGWVTKRKIDIYNLVQETQDFDQFLKKFYRLIYTNNTNINKKYCDYIIRFENLDEGLTEVLKKLDIEKIRPLPVVNKTKKKRHFISYYTNVSKRTAVNMFGPFMEEWEYEFPENWQNANISFYDKAVYEIGKTIRTLYSKHVTAGLLKKAALLRSRLE